MNSFFTQVDKVTKQKKLNTSNNKIKNIPFNFHF